MKTKNAFSLILLFLFAISLTLFSGCGENGEDDPNPPTNNNNDDDDDDNNNDDDDDDDDDDNDSPYVVSITSLDPESTEEISSMQPIFIEFDYDIQIGEKAKIYATPYFEGTRLSDFFTYNSPIYEGDGGTSTALFLYANEETKIDQIGMLIRDQFDFADIETIYFDVDYTVVKGNDNDIFLLSTYPTSPGTLPTEEFGLPVSVSYKLTGVTEYLDMYADLYFEGEELPHVAGWLAPSPIDPADGPDVFGTKSITINSDPSEAYQIDQIRVYFVADDDFDNVFFEKFFDVEFTWNPD